MKEILENIIKALVENKDKVQIKEEPNEIGITYYLEVDSADMGRIIGKHGKTITSLRTILKAAGLKKRQNIRLELVDQEGKRTNEKDE